MKGSASAARGAVEAHVVEPLSSLKEEMFSTLRDRRAIVTNEEFLAETEALERMLADFERDVVAKENMKNNNHSSTTAAKTTTTTSTAKTSTTPTPSSTTTSPSPSPLPMARLMRTYEDELRSPVRNLVRGELARCLLIQLQKVKVDSASALLEMDQVLRANELSLAATAAVPAVAAVWLFGYCVTKVLWRPRRGPPPDPRRAAAPLRSAFADAEAALAEAAAMVAAAEGEQQQQEIEEAEGRALFELGRALAAVDALLGLGPPSSAVSPGLLARAAAAALSPLLPRATPARAIGELSSSFDDDDDDDATVALPRIGRAGGGGGVLFATSAGAWRAGDAVRCRSGLVELAAASAPVAPLPTTTSTTSRPKKGDDAGSATATAAAAAAAAVAATSRVEAAARLARSCALLKQ